MLMLDEGLARVCTHLDLATLRFTATQRNRQLASANLADESERTELGNFFWQLLPALPAPHHNRALAAAAISWTSPTT